MGVDNNAILFVGLPLSEITDHLLQLPDFDQDAFDDDPREYLEGWAWDHQSDSRYGELVISSDSPCERGTQLIGYQLVNSGSYSCKEIENFVPTVNEVISRFDHVFRVKPKVYLYNWQW